MEQPNVKFAKHVLLIDVAFINEVTIDLRSRLSAQCGRELSLMDFPAWVSCLCLDAGIPVDGSEIQVLLVHNEGVNSLSGCQPGHLSDLDGMACRTGVGELCFGCVNSAGMTDCEHLFLDLMQLALDAANVEHLLLVPALHRYEDRVVEELEKLAADKGEFAVRKATLFTWQAQKTEAYTSMPVAFSLLHAWGVRPEEL